MRYFETLDTANEVCLRRAKKLMTLCGVRGEAERCNTFRQSGDDCTWWVLHYAEVEAREHHGEGQGACLSLKHEERKPQLKRCLKLASQQLEAARNTWLQKEQKEMAQTEAMRRMVQKRIGHKAYVRAELEKMRQRAALAAEVIHKGTKDLAEPEISVEKKKQSEKKLNINIDEALQK